MALTSHFLGFWIERVSVHQALEEGPHMISFLKSAQEPNDNLEEAYKTNNRGKCFDDVNVCFVYSE